MYIIQELKRTYMIEGAGKLQYFIGGNEFELGSEWEKEGIKRMLLNQDLH